MTMINTMNPAPKIAHFFLLHALISHHLGAKELGLSTSYLGGGPDGIFVFLIFPTVATDIDFLSNDRLSSFYSQSDPSTSSPKVLFPRE